MGAPTHFGGIAAEYSNGFVAIGEIGSGSGDGLAQWRSSQLRMGRSKVMGGRVQSSCEVVDAQCSSVTHGRGIRISTSRNKGGRLLSIDEVLTENNPKPRQTGRQPPSPAPLCP